MMILNTTPNTILLSDIEKYIPFTEDKEQEFSVDDAKKSGAFRKLIMLGDVKITHHDNSLFERNLALLGDNTKSPLKNSNTTYVKKVEVENIAALPELEVKIRGHFYEAGGYAKVNRNLVCGLNNLGIKVAIESTSQMASDLNETEVRKLSKLTKSVSRNAITIDSMIPTFSTLSGGRYRILYTTVEASSVPQQFLDVANTYNEVWVTSNFCKEVLEKAGLQKPIHVVQNTFDLNVYNEDAEPYVFNPPLKPFVFLSVFGWSYRKGYDVLLKAYLEEFKKDEPVSLLISSRFACSTDKSDIVKTTVRKFIDQYGGSKNTPHISLTHTVVPEAKMANFYKAANAFVLFSRGEGFSMTAAESSLCGLPVISTNYSGHTMFLNKDNSTLIDIDSLSPVESGMMHVHYWDGQLFPRLTSPKVITDARTAMRDVFENYKKAKKKNKKLQKFVKENYGIEKISLDVANRLNEIWRKLK